MNNEELYDKYYELLWAVSSKVPGETRHETALRLIMEGKRSSEMTRQEIVDVHSDSAMSVCHKVPLPEALLRAIVAKGE